MVNTDDYISWIQNELTFDNDKLADIIINLNKWYGVDIECPSEFAEKVFMSFSVRNGENLDEILKAMTLVAPIRYYWENGILHILPRKR
jgi:transmembrane sensor